MEKKGEVVFIHLTYLMLIILIKTTISFILVVSFMSMAKILTNLQDLVKVQN